MNIPDEAVEAAAKSRHANAHWENQWEDITDDQRYWFLNDARAALEAAAPYMLAEAWDEGLKRGAVGAYIHPAEYATNPYRSQA